VADVRSFRALRYDTAVAGPLDRLVAPPYDVISSEQREELRARSPHNVVHLTLPDSEDEAAAALAAWRQDGALVQDAEPAFWALEQDYVGPDGVARTRRGLVAALRVEPYERGVVLPHERTHAGPKEGRLRLLLATRTQLEPIFLLYEGEPVAAPRDLAPDIEVEGARLWRLPDDGSIAGAFADRRLLIADGHHRYETALAFHDEDGTEASAFMPVVLVSGEDSGLTIFPTHRAVRGGVEPANGTATEEALRRLAQQPADEPSAVLYRDGRASLVSSGDVRFDTELVNGEIVEYTPDIDRAVALADGAEADAAYLLRPPRVEDVWAVAARGDVMPQKSTYFFPKLLSGLLLYPLGD
jgi:uncharacterized protein (DUF1015 family)